MIKQIRTTLINFLLGMLVAIYVCSCTIAADQPQQCSKEEVISASDVVENKSVMEEQICQEIIERSELLALSSNSISNNEIEDEEESVSSNEIATDRQEQQEESEEELYREGWATQTTEVKQYPVEHAETLKKLKFNERIFYLQFGSGELWAIIKFEDGTKGYIKKEYVSKEKQEVKEVAKRTPTANISGNTGGLSAYSGVCYGPSGKETYYNLNMNGVINTMRRMGNTDEYWIREDGCKMLGDYIMVAADLNQYPRGSLVETSLGTGIVCDTGSFTHNGSGVSIDIATSW